MLNSDTQNAINVSDMEQVKFSFQGNRSQLQAASPHSNFNENYNVIFLRFF